MSEKFKVIVNLDEKTYEALRWYVTQTIYWAGNDREGEAIGAYAAHIIESWLEIEARNPQDAVTSIKEEMKLLLDLEK